VISKVYRILLIERHTNDIALPADALILVYSIEFGNGSVWIVDEGIVPTIFSVITP
jgi:hypothetical protein